MKDVDELCVNTIRMLSADAVQKANSGHAGLAIAIEAANKLEEKDTSVRVVSMPSWELFERQSEEYRHEVLPPDIKARVAIEAGITQGWHRYVGDNVRVIGIDHFGASAPYQTLYEKFELTSEKVVDTALACL